MDWLPKYEFDKCVKKYRGNYHVRELSCYEQYLVVAFAESGNQGSVLIIANKLAIKIGSRY
ncbi:MAG: DUF4372 domain-containing protein [Kiritimatiellae bacterium]|nr:DUF4372 domain-containing protein [Kiritimatiellia bacterium]